MKRTFKLDLYLFGDAGIINFNAPTDYVLKLGSLRTDAGLGAAFTIKKFGVLQTVKPLTIRFDFPFFLNKISPLDKGYFQYRSLISVNRAF